MYTLLIARAEGADRGVRESAGPSVPAARRGPASAERTARHWPGRWRSRCLRCRRARLDMNSPASSCGTPVCASGAGPDGMDCVRPRITRGSMPRKYAATSAMSVPPDAELETAAAKAAAAIILDVAASTTALPAHDELSPTDDVNGDASNGFRPWREEALNRRAAGRSRTPSQVLRARMNPSGLPIDEVLPDLRAALQKSRSVVLQAPPGAGKSTVVPLALLDEPWAHGKRLIMLEPRRLAARAVAQRDGRYPARKRRTNRRPSHAARHSGVACHPH